MVLRRFPSWFAMAAALFAATAIGTPAHAQQTVTPRTTPLVATVTAKANANTVGIISGKSDSAYLAAVEDLSAVLDDGAKLRIIAMIGKGALQNVRDILFLRNTDMGVTHANVLNYLTRTRELGPNITSRIRYISKLFNEEVHILAGKQITDLQSLEGQTVNFGERGSGTQLTAELVFEALGITVRPTYMIQSNALVAIKKNQIAATVLVAGKPSPLLARLQLDGQFNLLPVPYEEALENDYLPTKFTAKDYPGLIKGDDTVDTIAVPAVLAVFNWPKGGDRYRRVALFVNAFFSKFDEFRREPRHPKWREVNLTSKVTGWKRFPAAQEWLEKNVTRVSASPRRRVPAKVTSSAEQRGAFRKFIAKQQGAPAGNGNQEQLFQQFLSWMKNSGTSAPPSATDPSAPPATTGSTKSPTGGRLW